MKVINILVIICLLNGCSIVSKERPKNSVQYNIKKLEKTVNRNTNVKTRVVYFKKLLNQYIKVDDTNKQLQAHLSLASLYDKTQQNELAQLHLRHANMLHSMAENHNVSYQYYLTTGVINNSQQTIEKSLPLAKTDLQRALVYSHLQQADKALSLINNISITSENIHDVAFIHYQYANANKNEQYAKSALALYKQTEYSAGIAKALLLLAVINKNTDYKEYKNYLYRAQKISEILDEQKIKADLKKQIDIEVEQHLSKDMKQSWIN